MPGRELPTIARADIESRNTSESCYVTLGTKVFDVTDFIDDHPGGGDLILERGGTDVSAIMQDELSHLHTEAAYEILDDHLVGFVATEPVVDAATKSSQPDSIVPLPPSEGELKELRANGAAAELDSTRGTSVYESTGMSSAEDLSKETDYASDYKKHKFLDLNRPLLMQVWNGGFSKEFYLQQVHRPRHYRGGQSAPLFGNFLEPLSMTPWYVIPSLWWPCVAYGLYIASQQLSLQALVGYWVFGVCFWTIIEYVLHRFLFHIDKYLPDNRVGITLHFLLHGIHHYLPMDRYRLVMPPALFLVLALPFWKFAHTVLFYDWHAATAAYCGGIFGYTCYDMTHYFLHHRK